MRGIVFTMDAFFALFLVVAILPLLLLPLGRSNVDASSQLALQADDAVNVISLVRVRDIVREPVFLDLYNRGALGDNELNKTVMEYLGALWASNSTINNTYAVNISQHLFEAMLPVNVVWSLAIENDTLFQSGNTTEISVVSRRLESGLRKALPSQGYGASVYLTGIGGKRASSYYFFGGFVGQGNIAVKLPLVNNSNVTEIYLELNAGENLSLYVNNNFCSNFTAAPGNFSVSTLNITDPVCLSYVTLGNNNFSLNFTGKNLTNEYIGGGYLRLTYSTKDLLTPGNGLSYYNFPGVTGLLNIYDSFYVPGTLNSLRANLTLTTGLGYQALLYLGNTSVLNYTGTGQQANLTLNNSYLQQKLAANNVSYSDISGKTVPLRMYVVANLTPGNMSVGTDVILITDLSTSMDWQLDQDNNPGNSITNCSDPNIYSSTTSRISLARCLDKSFVEAILGGSNSACGTAAGATNNRIGLVGFSNSAYTWENLTTNLTYLESKITNYETIGSTCISCAINKAKDILTAQSGVNRTRYVVVMTDGEANYRSTSTCYDFNSVSQGFAVGLAGATASRLPPWLALNGTALPDFTAVAFVNNTFAKAAAPAGEIYNWNNGWVLDQDLGNSDIDGIDIYNRTLAFAVGSSAKIYRWNGASWAQDQDFGNFDFNAVKFFNSTLAFAVGDGGVIYRWNGAWSLNQTVTGNLYGVSIYNRTLGFAVGSSGKIYQFNGLAWNQVIDTGSNTHYSVAILNSTRAFTAASNGIYQWDGTSWTLALATNYALKGVSVFNGLAYAVGDSRLDIYEFNNTWSRTYSNFYYNGTSSTGLYCTDSYACSLDVGQSYPSLNANYSAYLAYKNIPNLTIDTVGVGPIISCNLGNSTLSEVAKTGNGTLYASANGTQLQTIYCQIAQNILTKQTPTQQVTSQGNLFTSQLTDSYLEFNYTPTDQPSGYQEISLDLETPPFSNCNGSIFLPPGMNLTNALRTSYSGQYWTKTVFVNAATAYNLTKYGKNYPLLGDPYHIYLPPSLFSYNTTNLLRNELGLNSTQTSPVCSQSDKLIYTLKLRASAPFGATFPKIYGSIYRIYYDFDHDGAADGYTDVTIGQNLPGFNSTVRTPDLLDPNNALDDAVLRLLTTLNFVPGAGVVGSVTNPIDIQLSNIDLSTAGTGNVPFAWGPLDVKIGVGL